MKPLYFVLPLLLVAGHNLVGFQSNALKEFFSAQIGRGAGVTVATYQDVLQVTDQIALASARDIQDALPSLFAVLGQNRTDLAINAAFAISVVALRPDSASLLKPWLPELTALFSAADSRLKATPALIILRMQPAPPPEVLPILTDFLKSSDTDLVAKGGVLYTLVQIAPTSVDTIEAINAFINLPLDRTTKINTLHALGSPNVQDNNILMWVAAALLDRDKYVRSAGVQSLSRFSIHNRPIDIVGKVVDSLADLDSDVKMASILSLSHFPPRDRTRAREALSDIVRNSNNDKRLRQMAEEALGGMQIN